MANAWDSPQWPERGDDSEDDVYLAVGRFLTAWEGVESVFAELYSAIVTKGEYGNNVAARAFGTIATFRGRAEMIEAAAEAYAANHDDADFLDELKEPMKEYRGFSARRNEIAHGAVTRYAYLTYALGEEIAGPERPGYVLVPPEYNTNKRLHSGRPKYVFNAAQIASFSEDFYLLEANARGLGIYFSKRYQPPLVVTSDNPENEESP